MRRTKAVAVQATGTGECWEPTDDERLEFKTCNQDSCINYLHTHVNHHNGGTRTLLNCSSLVDVTILLDGSGSLSSYGWWSSKRLASTLIAQLGDGSGNAQVALSLFSGPTNYPDYE